MNNTGNIIACLRELDETERQISQLPKDDPQQLEALQRLACLRTQIPAPILEYYNNRKSRGKRSVAAVRNGVCGSCHLAVPVGRVASLRANSHLNICDHCGTFIYMAEEDKVPVPAPAAKAEKAEKATKRTTTKKRTAKELQSA